MKPTPRPNPPERGERVGHILKLLADNHPPFSWVAGTAILMGIAAFYQYHWLMPLY